MTQLLGGLARFVQHPETEQVTVRLDLLPAARVARILVWFEFALSPASWPNGASPPTCSSSSTALFFFTCVVLYPDHLDEYDGFADYFHARQDWFPGLLATLFVVDLADSALKVQHLAALGPLYPLRQLLLAALALVAMRVRNRRFHIAFVTLALVAQVVWIERHYLPAVGLGARLLRIPGCAVRRAAARRRRPGPGGAAGSPIMKPSPITWMMSPALVPGTGASNIAWCSLGSKRSPGFGLDLDDPVLLEGVQESRRVSSMPSISPARRRAPRR